MSKKTQHLLTELWDNIAEDAIMANSIINDTETPAEIHRELKSILSSLNNTIEQIRKLKSVPATNK